jgi:hypothetical protein
MSPLELPESRFYFDARGHALSGTFRRPVPYLIPAQAAISLPTIGGHARSRTEDFTAEHLASFKLAHSHASGSQQADGTFTTAVTTTVEKLNILDVVTADRIVLRLTHAHKPSKSGKPQQGHILALGSHFDNLRIGGYDVIVTLRHELLIENDTYAKLRDKIATDKKSGKIAHVGDSNVLCSLVEKIETKLPGVDPKTHIIDVPHFGRVSFAELLLTPGSITATMIRLDLGSPDDATLAVAEVRVNGEPWP